MNNNARITPMTADQAIAEWDTLSSLFEKVMPRVCGRFGLDDVKDTVARGNALVLLVWDPEEHVIYAAILAEAEIYPSKRVFSLNMCGGEDIEQWGHLFPVIEYIAKKLGYDQIDILGRPGWKKFLPGTTSVLTQFTKDL